MNFRMVYNYIIIVRLSKGQPIESLFNIFLVFVYFIENANIGNLLIYKIELIRINDFQYENS